MSEGEEGRSAESLWSVRLNAGLTLNEVAARAQVSQGTVSALEHGGRAPMHAIEQRVADALGYSLEAIAWGAVPEGGSLDLVELRDGRGLRTNDVAARAGVPLSTLRRAEAGAAIHPRYAVKLAEFYGCRVTDFYPVPAEAVA